MPLTSHGNVKNAICLRCDNIDFDRPQDPAGYCSKYDKHVGLTGKPTLLALHYCLHYKDAGQKVYERNLQKMKEAGIGA